MNVRIIAGKFGGRVIKAPSGKITHPMSERVRGSLFNIIGDEICDAEVLDAFAGSGALGLEALSRGAKQATFIERDKEAARLIKDNIYSLGVETVSILSQNFLRTWINQNKGKLFDVIFTDPPYNDMQFSTVSRLCDFLRPNGLMVISYPGRGELPAIEKIVVVDNRSYGNAALRFYRKK